MAAARLIAANKTNFLIFVRSRWARTSWPSRPCLAVRHDWGRETRFPSQGFAHPRRTKNRAREMQMLLTSQTSGGLVITYRHRRSERCSRHFFRRLRFARPAASTGRTTAISPAVAATEPGTAVVYGGEPGTAVAYEGEPGKAVAYEGEPGTAVAYEGEPGTTVVYEGESGTAVAYEDKPGMAVAYEDEPDTSYLKMYLV